MGYKYFMNNPVGARVGDCAVRAISKALGISWEEAYEKLAVNGYRMCDMPSSNTVIASVLRQNGFYRENLPDYGSRIYTVREFAEHNPIGVYVLGLDNHIVCVKNGSYFDSWDSGDEAVLYFWTK